MSTGDSGGWQVRVHPQMHCQGLVVLCVLVGEITAIPLGDTCCYLPRDDLGQFIKILYQLYPAGSSAMCHLEYARTLFESVGGRMRLPLKARILVFTDESKAHFPHLTSRL